MTYKKELTDNGVVLVKNAWDSTDVKMISDEYDRDSMAQKRLQISDLTNYLIELVKK